MSAEGWQRETRRIVPTGHGQMHARLRGIGADGVSGAGAGRPLVLLHRSPRSRRSGWVIPRPGGSRASG